MHDNEHTNELVLNLDNESLYLVIFLPKSSKLKGIHVFRCILKTVCKHLFSERYAMCLDVHIFQFIRQPKQDMRK